LEYQSAGPATINECPTARQLGPPARAPERQSRGSCSGPSGAAAAASATRRSGPENELRQNSGGPRPGLKEHFILERIAEEEKIKDLPEDYDTEVRLIAAQSGETPRRVRARLEKAGGMDVLRNQIIERKAIDGVGRGRSRMCLELPDEDRSTGGGAANMPRFRAACAE
jgi:hypothetical protein